MTRGRKPGEIQNPRDERGWMVPREGTLRRRVYDAMVAGLPTQVASSKLGIPASHYRAYRQCIVSWKKVGEWRVAGEMGEAGG